MQTDEDLMIARHTKRVIGLSGQSSVAKPAFPYDCNIFRMIMPDGTSPMQYLLPHTRIVGYPIGLRP